MTPEGGAGRIAVVTGTGGIGLEAAVGLARQGYAVILGGRNREAGSAAVERIKASAPHGEARFLAVDLADLASVAAFANAVLAEAPQVDVLLNNAGVMSPPQRTLTRQGVELQFGVNHLAHFALTAHLLPALRRAGRARVVSVSSIAHRYGDLDLDDYNGDASYHPGIFYCRSKLAQAIFAIELQRRSDAEGWGLDSLAVHPGFARTNLFRGRDRGGDRMGPAVGLILGYLVGHSAQAGAQSLVYGCTSPEVRGGGLYGPRGLFEMRGRPGACKFAQNALRPETAQRLWYLSRELSGPFPAS